MPDPSHLGLLVRLHPSGTLWRLEEGATQYAELKVWAYGLDSVWVQRNELVDEILPDQSTELLSSWERVYDVHPPTGRSVARRRQVVVGRRRILPSFTPSTIEEIVTATTGVAATVIELSPFKADQPGAQADLHQVHNAYLDEASAFTFFVEMSAPGLLAAGVRRAEVDSLLELIRPAHTISHVRCDDFRTEDEFSLLDYDRIGA